MQKELQLTLTPKEASQEAFYKSRIARKLNIPEQQITSVRILRRSIDSRHGKVRVNLHLLVFTGETMEEPFTFNLELKDVSSAIPVIIIGAGPAGLFAALKLIESGIKPVILERGKKIAERKKDIARISKEHFIHPDSNYCFGEGGAGTFSDGKLYTRAKKRGDTRRILNILHLFGAAHSILYDAHPHIGTDKLPGIIRNIREAILNAGGEIHFNSRVTGFVIRDRQIHEVVVRGGTRVSAPAVILAAGHSARDIYYGLSESGIFIEPKSFAVGVRIEHPQTLIDTIQYHNPVRSEYLPAASYNLVQQVEGRGVYSFCMCPGGFIVPSATSPDEVVVNGMSPSARNSPFANAGMVVEIHPRDIIGEATMEALAGLAFQEKLEKLAWEAGGKKQTAPAQRLADFVARKQSQSLPATSYSPGITSSALHMWMPKMITNHLRNALIRFDQKMRGFVTNQAILLAVESRTSSPVRIPRDPVRLHHPAINNLYPCGEGSGFAGGIVSSAMDGENVAVRIAERL